LTAKIQENEHKRILKMDVFLNHYFLSLFGCSEWKNNNENFVAITWIIEFVQNDFGLIVTMKLHGRSFVIYVKKIPSSWKFNN
jgi:hypothetical protein